MVYSTAFLLITGSTPGIPRQNGTHQAVGGRRLIVRSARAEHLALRQKLHMDFKANYSFVFHLIADGVAVFQPAVLPWPSSATRGPLVLV